MYIDTSTGTYKWLRQMLRGVYRTRQGRMSGRTGLDRWSLTYNSMRSMGRGGNSHGDLDSEGYDPNS